jgi:hypothetical protein
VTLIRPLSRLQVIQRLQSILSLFEHYYFIYYYLWSVYQWPFARIMREVLLRCRDVLGCACVPLSEEGLEWAQSRNAWAQLYGVTVSQDGSSLATTHQHARLVIVCGACGHLRRVHLLFTTAPPESIDSASTKVGLLSRQRA